MKSCQTKGKLYLVSAGIGDPDNMTLRAHRIVSTADIVLTMQFLRKQYAVLLAGKEVHDAGHGLFTKIEEGKGAYGDKEKIRSVIREGVAAGQTVVVLDFGDPVLYGPHSGYLREFADLKPVVVPGVSSFNAANAALGVELTGDYDRAVVLSEAMDNHSNDDHLARLAATGSTLILFTMRMNIERVYQALKRHFSGETPVAMVCGAGFSARERVIRTSLDQLTKSFVEEQPPWDYLLYIGPALKEVVSSKA